MSFYALFQDGIVDPADSTLRDFCGRCIQEFLKWSIKQTTPQQQENSPVNTKSLFKRLYSFALHPNAFKRLGASLAFNNIYREFRCVSYLTGKSVKIFKFSFLIFIYVPFLFLAVSGLSCSRWDLCWGLWDLFVMSRGLRSLSFQW